MLLITALTFSLLVILGAPIVLALGAAAFGAVLWADIPLSLLMTRMFSGLDSFPLMAIPFFVLTGELMNTGGITRRLVNFANKLVGHMAGGLAQVNIVSSIMFAGISGSSAADVSSIGSMMIPAMKRDGYRPEFAVAVTATSSCLGNVIPPSLFMILLGAITGISIGGMFLGGIVPGLLIAAGLMALSYAYSKKHGTPVTPRASLGELFQSFVSASLALVTPVIIMGGIVLGIVTPTEAGVLAAVYSLILGLFVYREYDYRGLMQVFTRATQTTAIAVIVLATASVFSWVLARERLPQTMTNVISTISDNQVIVHLLIIGMLIVIGMVLEANSALIIFIPFLFPVASTFGIDPIHFGVTAAIALVIGLVTPPIGMILFLACTIGDTSVKDTLAFIFPQIAIMVGALILIVLFPALVTYLPGLIR